jgi:hypothetical protein
MNKNLIYTGILAILAANAFYLVKEPAGNTEKFDREMFSTDTLRIVGAVLEKYGQKITLTKGVKNWFIEGPKNYPADPAAVKTLLKFADELTLKNIISDKPERHFRFGVDSTGTVLKFRLQDNSEKTFIIGNDDQDKRHSFYRKQDGNDVYLGTLFPRYRLGTNVNDWRDKAISRTNREDISKVSITKNKNTIELLKTNGEWSGILNGNKKEFDQELIKKLIDKLSLFRAEGFMDDIDISGLNEPVTILFEAMRDLKEIVITESEGVHIAYVRDKMQGYKISSDDYEVITDLFR